MANSEEVSLYKQKAISLIINNPEIVSLIISDDGKPVIEYADDLIYERVFPFIKAPETEQELSTYLFMTVDIPSNGNQNNLLKNVVFTFVVVTHYNLMRVQNRVGNRLDILSALIDKQFNEKDYFGLGKIKLVSNTEGCVDKTHPCRTIKFVVEDLNNKRCCI